MQCAFSIAADDLFFLRRGGGAEEAKGSTEVIRLTLESVQRTNIAEIGNLSCIYDVQIHLGQKIGKLKEFGRRTLF